MFSKCDSIPNSNFCVTQAFYEEVAHVGMDNMQQMAQESDATHEVS